MPDWTRAFPLDSVPLGGARLFKQTDGAGPSVQVAVFRLAEGVYAIDNRCPHQGYPLTQGTVSGCVLTCQWHNYKFDLRDGACVMGEEPVRSYPARVVDGAVEIDLAPSASLLAGLWGDLDLAMERHEVGRIARNVVRLLDLGVSRVELARAGATFDAAHGEYGPSHALPLAAEAALRGAPGVEPALPIVQALDLAARSTVRLPTRKAPEAVDPGDDPVAAGARVRALVEAEHGAEAEALVRGAVARGWGRAELQPWFFALCADHFVDFGHALIYSVKGFDLLEAAPVWAPRDAATILGALTWGIACGTREDLLPPWSGWRRRMVALDGVASDGAASDGVASDGAVGEGTALALDALVDAEPAAAFALVAASADPLDALAIAASERLLRFDVRIDGDATVAEGWLDVTHTLTFVNAVRHARARGAPDDEVRRLMLQAAQFVAMTRALDGARCAMVPMPATVEEVVAAVKARRADAVALAAGCLREGDAGALIAALEARAWQDHGTRAVFLAHHVKTLRAAAEERLATGDDRPLLGAIRFLAGPLRERSVERTVNDAIELVRHGRPPRGLIS